MVGDYFGIVSFYVSPYTTEQYVFIAETVLKCEGVVQVLRNYRHTSKVMTLFHEIL
jgi:hypothetical protein